MSDLPLLFQVSPNAPIIFAIIFIIIVAINIVVIVAIIIVIIVIITIFLLAADHSREVVGRFENPVYESAGWVALKSSKSIFETILHRMIVSKIRSVGDMQAHLHRRDSRIEVCLPI